MKSNADRYFYLGSLGLCLLVIGLFFMPAGKHAHAVLAPYFIGVALLGGVAGLVLTWGRAYLARRWRACMVASLKTLGWVAAMLAAGIILLVSQYMAWAARIEAQGLQSGVALDQAAMSLAKDIGIKAPEKIRVIRSGKVPYPVDNPGLKFLGESLGFIGEGIVNNAQVFGYSIFVREGYALDRPRLAHELVHVLQIERSSFQAVTVQYIWELALYGYENTAAEIEAFKANEKYAIGLE